jgi:hypothetical protein
MPRSFLRPLLLLALTFSVSACKENGNDYLQEGLRLLGEAERGDCKPEVEQGQMTIDAAKVAQCLDKTKQALEQLHKARELGNDGREVTDLIAKTEDEVTRLESMLKMVARLQHDP